MSTKQIGSSQAVQGLILWDVWITRSKQMCKVYEYMVESRQLCDLATRLWDKLYSKFCPEWRNLDAEAHKLCDEGHKLLYDARVLSDQSHKLWIDAVRREFGDITITWIDDDCHLGNGEIYKGLSS